MAGRRFRRPTYKPPISNPISQISKQGLAESAGVEPARRLRDDGLANHSLDRAGHSPFRNSSSFQLYFIIQSNAPIFYFLYRSQTF